MTTFKSYIRHPRSAVVKALTPREVAKAYNFPPAATGKGYVGAIIELGGGYNAKQVSAYFTRNGLPVPTFLAKTVAGGANSQDGPDGADGEVQLDMLVAGSVAPAATWIVYFAPNTDDGFDNAINQAIKDGCNGITISWGSAEDGWDSSSIEKFEATFLKAREAGIAVFAASGDSGSKDSESHNVTDYPASSPNVIGCGGTRLQIDSNGARSSEVAWNDDPISSATGGGISKVFPGRQVPDVAGNADPNTGYIIDIDGQQGVVVGGDSAVAPLFCALHALLWELDQHKAFDFLNLTVTNPQAFFDVTQGDNGGYRAGPGRDNTTGIGVPDGAKLASAITSGIAPPVPPTPVPSPTPGPAPTPDPTTGDPLADFPTAQVKALVDHKHNYNSFESKAVDALQYWALEHGILL